MATLKEKEYYLTEKEFVEWKEILQAIHGPITLVLDKGTFVIEVWPKYQRPFKIDTKKIKKERYAQIFKERKEGTDGSSF